ncbi:MAG TPA: hypothetical protein VKA84_01175, partial [Gemmatimonadaceae bacterium]|nr:hypothetical protein [Gemmatimonadaceae bacterium]
TLDRGADPCAIVTAEVAGHDARDVVAELARRRINATATLQWYGLLDLGARGVETAVRLSPHYYNTTDEVDAAAAAVAEVVAGRAAATTSAAAG